MLSNKPMIDHATLMRMMGDHFPEEIGAIAESRSGLLHCEVAVLRGAAENAIDEGRLWAAEKRFRFMADILSRADPEVENAIEVSFLEDFAIGEWTGARYEAVKTRCPEPLRSKLAAYDSRWK
jgi:hypothetical protein